MADIIQGIVLKIIDFDTFEMNVSNQASQNKFNYMVVERIKLEGVDISLFKPSDRKQAKQNLSELLNKQNVECEVQTRDSYNRIVAKVKILE